METNGVFFRRFDAEEASDHEELLKLSLWPSTSSSSTPPPSSSSPRSGKQDFQESPCLPFNTKYYEFLPCKPSLDKRLFLKSFDCDKDHEELLKLSLWPSTSNSSAPPPPASSHPSRQQDLQDPPRFPSNTPYYEFFPCKPSPKKRLFSQSFDSDTDKDHEELLKLSLSIGSGPSSSSASPSTQQKLSLVNNSNSQRRLFRQSFDGEEEHKELPRLSLSIGPRPSAMAPKLTTDEKLPFLNNPNPNPVLEELCNGAPHCRPRSRVRKNPFQAPKGGKSQTVPAPYPWATSRRATVHDLNYLLSHGMSIISGDVECKGCQGTYKIEYNLGEKFKEIKDFISANKFAMHDRAPAVWMEPTLESCKNCAGPLKPVIAKKRNINWLFLLLGNMLGCCRLSDLKYFCKHTKNHRTGAKDRVLYLTYLGLCKQLDPNGPFDS